MQIRKFGFDIVHGCQLRCVGCPNSVIKPRIQRVPVDVFAACLANVDVARVRLMRLFNFGEPLLHDDLPGIMEAVRKAPFELGLLELSTNAQHHDFVALEEALKVGALGRLAVSCDGDGTPGEYERLRPPGKWDRLLTFLETASRLRDRHAPGLRLITRTICTSPEGRQRWLDVLTPLGWEPEFRGWLKMPQSSQEPWEAARNIPAGPCEYVQRHTLYVDADGTVVPCCVHPRAAVLGNLTTQRYTQIHDGPGRRELLARLRTDRAGHPVCGQCEEPPKKTAWQKLVHSVQKRLPGGAPEHE